MLSAFCSLPGLLYLLLESGFLRGDAGTQGSRCMRDYALFYFFSESAKADDSYSVWVFLLLSAEVIKSHRTNPFFLIGPYKIPTWTIPLPTVLFISLLVPQTTLLGNLSGTIVGYLWGFGYIKFLAPPERVLRFIESKLNLLGRLPHFVSTDRKTYGRYGVLDAVEERPVSTA